MKIDGFLSASQYLCVTLDIFIFQISVKIASEKNSEKRKRKDLKSVLRMFHKSGIHKYPLQVQSDG